MAGTESSVEAEEGKGSSFEAEEGKGSSSEAEEEGSFEAEGSSVAGTGSSFEAEGSSTEEGSAFPNTEAFNKSFMMSRSTVVPAALAEAAFCQFRGMPASSRSTRAPSSMFARASRGPTGWVVFAAATLVSSLAREAGEVGSKWLAASWASSTVHSAGSLSSSRVHEAHTLAYSSTLTPTTYIAAPLLLLARQAVCTPSSKGASRARTSCSEGRGVSVSVRRSLASSFARTPCAAPISAGHAVRA